MHACYIDHVSDLILCTAVVLWYTRCTVSVSDMVRRKGKPEIDAHVEELLKKAAIRRHECFNNKNLLPEKKITGGGMASTCRESGLNLD